MEQKFEEVLKAIAKSHPEEPNGKKSVGEEHSSDPVFSWVETMKGTNPTRFSGGSRNGTGGGSDGGGGDHTIGGEYNGGTNWRIKKLEIPLFNGNNSNGWALEAERRFVDYQLSEEEKLEVAVVALEGYAALWYDEEHYRRPIRDWEELKFLIIRQFGSSTFAAESWWSDYHGARQSEHQWSLREITDLFDDGRDNR
ncbi:unnamed protein product [Lactuca saligna]|uniref:Retrotransposon gag domain-containing protein n=1 Tax=Lactuca saligna TaxID=75948 RepID=A0AA36EK43_LACSI|nr:unnamed protein product [Lactuca saligna]